jgi:hypothetical protein
MTADEYRAALAALGLTQVAAGRVLGVTGRASQSYCAKGPPAPVALAVRLLLSLPRDQRAKWLEPGHHPAKHRQSPLSGFEGGPD